ncbi:MAG: imidazole glycerol phosphate synthase subunit HisH [Chlorobi bacterium]|nr:imidazole glycerol phosphate synthase subunit HisH [Chlorobiota bacterium]
MIGIIDYGAANIRSVCNALERIGAGSFVSGDPAQLDRATRLILPGVGSAKSAIGMLRSRGLAEWIRLNGKPLLGICLGMQLLYEYSDEGSAPCLGMMKGTIHRFTGNDIKVPHIGWNTVRPTIPEPLFSGLEDGAYFYFVHSYFAAISPQTVAVTDHGGEFSSVVACGNIRGVQFHPEKSGPAGLRLLRNFIEHC